MDRHQRDLVGLVALRVLAVVFLHLAHQVDVFEIIVEADHRVDGRLAVFREDLSHLGLFLAVVLDAVEEFLHILETAQALRGGIGFQSGQIARIRADLQGQRIAFGGLHLFAQRFHQRHEVAQLLDGGVLEPGGVECLVREQDRIVEGGVGCCGCCGEAVDGGVADAAPRDIDDPAEGLVVLRVDCQLEVGQHILDLGPLVEGVAAVDAEGEVALAQRFLERPALGVGAVKDRKAVVRRLGGVDALHDGRDDQVGLLALGEGLDDPDLLADACPREAFFAEPALVVGDQAVGRCHDGLGGAVVLLETEFLRLGIILLEA